METPQLSVPQDNPMWSPLRARGIVSRIVVEATLRLKSPAHFGNGEADDLVDMPLLVDEVTGRPMLTGSTLAGALRAYLEARIHGYGLGQIEKNSVPEEESKLVGWLFGEAAEKQGAMSSPLIVDDAIAEGETGIEVRAGVRIDAESMTAADDLLFFRNMWQAGTTFPVRFELEIAEQHQKAGKQWRREAFYEQNLLRAFGSALEGLSKGHITLGSRRRRGYGEIEVTNWRAKRYNLRDSVHLMAWLAAPLKLDASCDVDKDNIADWLLPKEATLLPDRRAYATIKATMSIPHSILIRSVTTNLDETADDVHLQRELLNLADSNGESNIEAVISGTSLAGVMRMQAGRIAHVRCKDRNAAKNWMNNLFGKDLKQGPERKVLAPVASRVVVAESVIDKGTMKLLQQRVAIDPFTGGAADAMLFSQRPSFGGQTTFRWTILNPKDQDLGILLLVLKDLWTGHLAIGGNTSAGRGRLDGIQIDIDYRPTASRHDQWRIKAEDERLDVGWLDPDKIDHDKSATEELEALIAAISNGALQDS